MSLTFTEICSACHQQFAVEVPDGAIAMARFLLKDKLCGTCRDRRAAELDRIDAELRAKSIHHRKQDFWARSGVPREYQDSSFEAFDAAFDGGRHQEAYRSCIRWADGFDPRKPWGYPSVVLYSTSLELAYGTGKTHLATAMLRRVIERLGEEALTMPNPVHFTTATDALLRISAARRPDFAGGSRESEEDVYLQLASVRVLVLDDVGKERPRADREEFYYTVINRRYANGLPVILTSNVPPDHSPHYREGPVLADVIGHAAVSRLRVMAAGYWLPMDGPDYRRHQARERIRRGG